MSCPGEHKQCQLRTTQPSECAEYVHLSVASMGASISLNLKPIGAQAKCDEDK